MSMMKRIGIPILEALSEGACTRTELFERVESRIDLKWETFKRFMGFLRSDGMIKTLPISDEHPHTRIALSDEGLEVVGELLE
tara:strand:- start:330 stop:578 length:249 start_codon:yes stop_codon:yes gene_type:complete